MQSTLPSDRVPLTGSAAMVTLRELLRPQLVVDSWDGDGSPSDAEVRTTITVRLLDRDSGHTGTLQIRVASPRPQQPPTGGFDCKGHPDTDQCVPIKGKDGERGTVYLRQDESQQISYLSELVRPDDVQILMLATGTDGNEPVVTRAEISNWVLSPGWQPVIDRKAAEDAARRMETDPAVNPKQRPDARIKAADASAVATP